MAKYKVRTVEFDFSDSFGEGISEAYQEKIIKETLERTWLADDEEDLVDAISEEYAWCVSAIEYEEMEVDYSSMTNEEFDSIFDEIVSRMSVDEILSFGDIRSILREELNNEILSAWEERTQ